MGKIMARLKPHDPKRGNVLKALSIGDYTFHAGTWQDIDEKDRPELAERNQVWLDERTPLAFEFATPTRAREISIAEQRTRDAEMYGLPPIVIPPAVEADEPVESAASETATDAPAKPGRKRAKR